MMMMMMIMVVVLAGSATIPMDERETERIQRKQDGAVIDAEFYDKNSGELKRGKKTWMWRATGDVGNPMKLYGGVNMPDKIYRTLVETHVEKGRMGQVFGITPV
jgi:hypothetical protein